MTDPNPTQPYASRTNTTHNCTAQPFPIVLWKQDRAADDIGFGHSLMGVQALQWLVLLVVALFPWLKDHLGAAQQMI